MNNTDEHSSAEILIAAVNNVADLLQQVMDTGTDEERAEARAIAETVLAALRKLGVGQ